MANRPPSGCENVTAGWKVRRMVSSMRLHFARYTSRALSGARQNQNLVTYFIADVLEQYVGVPSVVCLAMVSGMVSDFVEHEEPSRNAGTITFEKLPRTARGPRCPSTMIGTSPEKRSSP